MDLSPFLRPERLHPIFISTANQFLFADPSGKSEVFVGFWGRNYKPLDNEIHGLLGAPDAHLAKYWTSHGNTIPGLGENLSVNIQKGHMINTKKENDRSIFSKAGRKSQNPKEAELKSSKITCKIEVRRDDHQAVFGEKEQAENLQVRLKTLKVEQAYC